MSRAATTRNAGPRLLLPAARGAAVALLTALVVAAGVHTSWDTARYVMIPDDRQSGRLTLESCDKDACTGSFEPDREDGTAAREAVRMAQPIGRTEGETVPVVLRPDTDDAMRTGLPGVLYSWLPLTGALLLAAVVIAGGLRLYRIGWIVAGSGLTLLVATFLAW
ncbi:hypothetical protein [Streptomyces aidingensis]|uniref:Uncharacterized protein n=1 Tax=Streptomyces aidingensis TaxID=910347 RepID=A0A1I1GTJ3_9ACTN|nr:hypothetical protein [Streptomyces aidingensis]SFC15097.1 hypothetical protein SAMN05421773_102134 [Streptomyces aidingensis]